MEKFKNIFEVRKALRFELKAEKQNRNLKISSQEINLGDFYENYKSFIEYLGNLFFKKVEVIEEKKENGYKPFANIDFSILGISDSNLEEEKKSKNKYEKEWNDTIKFKYKGLEELFLSDWIKYQKQIKYDKRGNKKQKNYIVFSDLGNNNFVKEFFEKFFNEAEVYLKKLENFVNSGNENKARQSDILFLIQKINSREHLGKLYIFFEKEYIEDKNDTKNLKKIGFQLKELKENIYFLLNELRKSQSFGFPIEHISLNYYSINKTPKELNERIEKKLKENNLDIKYKWVFKNKDLLDGEKSIKSITHKFDNYELWKIFEEELKKEELKKEDENGLNLGELKEFLKLFKAKQKAALIQKMQEGKEINDLFELEKKNGKFLKDKKYKSFKFEFMGETYDDFQIILFDDIKNKNKDTNEIIYNEMLSLTKQIEQTKNKEEKTELKKKRGKYLQDFGKDTYLKNYVNFSKLYKQVAQKYGFANAEIKALERQKIDAEKQRGWGFLSKIGNDYFLNTFNVENTKNVYRELKNFDSNGNDIQIFILSSITLIALDKLCFKKDSSFIQKLFGKIDYKYKEKYKVNEGKRNEKEFTRLKSKSKLLEEGILLDFYIDVLEKQNTLNIQYRDEKSLRILKNSKNLEEFEINLKLETYNFIEKNFSKNNYEEIINKYKGNSYKITSYDLEKNKETKKYTKWWFDLWNNKNKQEKYIVRLNPELTIFFKEKDKDFKIENIKGEKKENRRLKDRYILATNISFHSDKAYIDSAFINEENRKESIKEFNKIFNKNNKYDYFYGLDKGTNELITLGIFKNQNSKLKSVNISEKIPVYKITKKGFQHFEYIYDDNGKIAEDNDGKERKRYLAKNVSYFVKDLNNKDLFEKIEINSCLGDLTYAKIIKGNIILNADIFTTINLYKKTAKRFLYDAITQGKFQDFGFDEKEGAFNVYYNRGKKREEPIFYWKKEFDLLPSEKENLFEEIKEELEEYISDLKNYLEDPKKYQDDIGEDISIQKINNYKNAISANVVGIIIELQKYFSGYICFETLDEGQIQKKGNNTFIGNVVNEKIYNRLQLNLEVPPILKKFRTDIGKKDITQHGKVIYIDENATSSACPICNKTLLEKNKDGKLVEKEDVYKLFGHLTEFENKMHHCTDECKHEYKKLNGEKAGKKEDFINKDCTFYLQNPDFPEFDFIKSGDDLAAYNIAKKVKEYIENL